MRIQRRSFLKLTALSGGGLALGFSLTACSKPVFPHRRPAAVQPNAFLQLTDEGRFILQLHRAEMGQGVYTGMATLAAEELEIDPQQLVIEHAEYHPDFRDPEMQLMVTGGSSSIRNSYQPLREAAASLALILRQAAAQLGVSQPQQTIPQLLAQIQDSPQWPEFLSLAAQQAIPDEVPLKPAADLQYIGRYNKRLDARDKVTGRAKFATDLQDIDGVVDAVLLRCPHIGGAVKSVDATAALALPTTEAVFEVDGAIAVLASGYWHARQAAQHIQVEWDKGPLAGLNNQRLKTQRHELMAGDDGHKAEEQGEESAAIGREMSASYEVPYLAHATMEPPNAIARVSADRAEIWAGNQAPDIVIGAVAAATGLAKDTIRVHSTLLGGGFGRKTLPDYIVQAARIAQLSGKTIRLQWSREEDIQQDCYRPNASCELRATIDQKQPTSLQIKVSCPSVLGSYLPQVMNGLLPSWVPGFVPSMAAGMAAKSDYSSSEGLTDSPYQFNYKRVDYFYQDTSLPVGYWRSVGHSQNAFFLESFIDEIATQCGSDPLSLRRQLLAEDREHLRVLDALAKLSNWGQGDVFQGMAIHKAFGTVVGEVVTLRKTASGLKIERIDCVVDCGQVINPDNVVAQMESGIVFGLTAALKGHLDIVEGAVQQSNFHDYPLLRINETPEIVVEILDSDKPPQGVGEPSTPPVAPALANALFAATGVRQRQLPLTLA